MAKSPKSRGLGRGFEALFAEQSPIIMDENAEKTDNEDQVQYIDINAIRPNKNQPRKSFNEEKIEELAESIKEHGIIQPLVVRRDGEGYEIVAGERRWRAARKSGLKKVPCLIREFTDEENMLVAIIENLQREDLNPIEEAEGLNRMIDTYGLTQEQVSKSVSKSRPYISNSLRLLKLPKEIRDLVQQGELTAGHARALVNVSPERQMELCQKVLQEKLSVRQLEKLITDKPKSRRRKIKKKSADILRVESDLKDKLGTRVTIKSKGNKGTIELEYYSSEDLERLIEILKNAY